MVVYVLSYFLDKGAGEFHLTCLCNMGCYVQHPITQKVYKIESIMLQFRNGKYHTKLMNIIWFQ